LFFLYPCAKIKARQVILLNETEKQQRQQKYQEKIKAFRLMDDEFMTKCFENNIECVELVLGIILGRQDLQVIEVKTQVFVENLSNRSVRLDVLAEDGSGRKYNIEIQRAKKGAGYKRARYNSSMMDLNLLQKSEDFDKLPETYVIFITENDVIGKGLPLYRIERYNLDTDEIIDDGEHILYVNGACQDETALGKLMQDFANPNPNSMNYRKLAECVDFYKNSKEGNAIMSEVIERMWNEAKHEASRENALRMLAAGKYELEEIVNITGLSLDEVKQLQKEKTA